MKLKAFHLLLSIFILAPVALCRAGLAASSPGAVLAANPPAQALQPNGLLAAHPGDLDPTFGDGGKRVTPIRVSTTHWPPFDAVLQPDGKIAIAAHTNYSNDIEDFLLARFNFDGSPDLSFGSAGQTVVDFDGRDDSAYALAIQADAKLLAAGGSVDRSIYSFNGLDFALARCLPDGRIDLSFGTDGRVLLDFGLGEFVALLALLEDGRILAAGPAQVDITSKIAIARLLVDGSLDPTFGEGGKILVDFGSYSTPYLSLLQTFPSGGFLIAGSYATKFYNMHGIFLLRLLEDGNPDASFGQNGWVRIQDVDTNDSFKAVVTLPDGKYLFVGNRWTDLNRILLMMRINPDGSLDTTFGQEGRLTDPQFGINLARDGVQVQPDGTMLVGGIIPQEIGSDFAVRRYLPDGILDSDFGSAGLFSVSLLGHDQVKELISDRAGRLLIAGDSFDYSDYTFVTMVRVWYDPPVNAYKTWFPVVGK